MTIDYTQLDQPQFHLKLERESDRYLIVVNHDNSIYYRAESISSCQRFMTRFAELHGATIDETSVEQEWDRMAARGAAWIRAHRATLGEPTAVEDLLRSPVPSAGMTAEPASPSNVHPIRKEPAGRSLPEALPDGPPTEGA